LRTIFLKMLKHFSSSLWSQFSLLFIACTYYKYSALKLEKSGVAFNVLYVELKFVDKTSFRHFKFMLGFQISKDLS